MRNITEMCKIMHVMEKFGRLKRSSPVMLEMGQIHRYLNGRGFYAAKGGCLHKSLLNCYFLAQEVTAASLDDLKGRLGRMVMNVAIRRC